MKAPFFKFSPSDWLAGIIQSVGYAERGIFIELCARIWNGAEVRRGDKLARLLRIDREELDAALDELAELDIITIDENGNIGVKFLAHQADEIAAVSEAAREKANARWKREAKAIDCNAPAMHRQCTGNADAMHRQCNKDKDKDKDIKESILTDAKEKTTTTEKESFVESSLKPTADFGRWSEEQFRRSVSAAVEKHPEYKPCVEDFSRYWLEPDRRGKYRFALEKTWSTAGRLATWYQRQMQRGGIQQTTSGGWQRDPKTGIVTGTGDEESYAEWKRNGGF